MAFARIDALLPTTAGNRVNPVLGGRVGDSVGAKGHRGESHEGLDIGGTASRAVRAPSPLQTIRVVDARKDDPKKSRGAAGPYWIDAYELDKSGSTTGNVLRFLHLEEIAPGVKAGARIERSKPLGKYWAKTFEGNPGHLHFEVRSKSGANGYGEVRDPVKWLRGEDRRIVRIVSMLNKQDIYKTLSDGQTLYAQSGQRMTITDLPGYPWIQATVEDQGEIRGEVTNDIGEAADWTIKQAEQDIEHSWSKDGLLGLNSWAYRIRGMSDRIAAAKKLAPQARYAEAWAIRRDIANIRGESFVTSQARAAKAAAVQGAEVARDTAQSVIGGVAGGLWEAIPTGVKVGAAVAVTAALVIVLKD
jgi:hypothetical protein